jgi:hypothetical protein
VPLTVRDNLDADAARPILRRLAEVEWDSVEHLPAQLAAVTVGDDATRDEAWWNVWDCIRHHGTIDEAVLPAVPVLTALADWHGHPDRAHALVLLREVATAEGIGPTHDHAEFADLREALAAGTRHLAARWRSEPPEVRRGLAFLLSAVPEVGVRYHALIDATLPAHLRQAWDAELVEPSRAPALARWVFDGE